MHSAVCVDTRATSAAAGLDLALTGGGWIVVANDYDGAFLCAQGAETEIAGWN